MKSYHGLLPLLLFASCASTQKSASSDGLPETDPVAEKYAAAVQDMYQNAASMTFDAELSRTWTTEKGIKKKRVYTGTVLMTGEGESKNQTTIRTEDGRIVADMVSYGNVEQHDGCLYGSLTEHTWLGRKGSPPPFSEWIKKSKFERTEIISGKKCAVFSFVRDSPWDTRVDWMFVRANGVVVRWDSETSEKPNGLPVFVSRRYNHVDTARAVEKFGKPGQGIVQKKGDQR